MLRSTKCSGPWPSGPYFAFGSQGAPTQTGLTALPSGSEPDTGCGCGSGSGSGSGSGFGSGSGSGDEDAAPIVILRKNSSCAIQGRTVKSTDPGAVKTPGRTI
ncbi:MAG: hypothetical protein B6D46_12975 [Polyangiaceae bacterium UTPRO1]|nr:MAG: hypothetical protein B6D46_12975 [Polyangiaceae bacterium UTPRO1]